MTYSYSCNCIVAYVATLSAYINDNLIVASYQLLVSCSVMEGCSFINNCTAKHLVITILYVAYNKFCYPGHVQLQ